MKNIINRSCRYSICRRYGFLTADFPDDYLTGKPDVRFINKMYHLNISPSNDHVSMPTLNNWKPNTTFSNVITSIFALHYFLLRYFLTKIPIAEK